MTRSPIERELAKQRASDATPRSPIERELAKQRASDATPRRPRGVCLTDGYGFDCSGDEMDVRRETAHHLYLTGHPRAEVFV